MKSEEKEGKGIENKAGGEKNKETERIGQRKVSDKEEEIKGGRRRKDKIQE